MVMYLGHIVETLPAKDLEQHAAHPYTKPLLSSVFSIKTDKTKAITPLEGEIPSNIHIHSGCPFHTRCPHCTTHCQTTPPPQVTLGPQHTVACHLFPYTY